MKTYNETAFEMEYDYSGQGDWVKREDCEKLEAEIKELKELLNYATKVESLKLPRDFFERVEQALKD